MIRMYELPWPVLCSIANLIFLGKDFALNIMLPSISWKCRGHRFNSGPFWEALMGKGNVPPRLFDTQRCQQDWGAREHRGPISNKWFTCEVLVCHQNKYPPPPCAQLWLVPRVTRDTSPVVPISGVIRNQV